jgi:hypothetical protein
MFSHMPVMPTLQEKRTEAGNASNRLQPFRPGAIAGRLWPGRHGNGVEFIGEKRHLW